MKKPKAVVTLCVGDEYGEISRLTHPSIQRYADRIGADFILITDRAYPLAHPGYEKMQMGRLLDDYQRIIYLDTDLIVRSDAPDLFDVVPVGMYGGVDEAANGRAWTKEEAAPLYEKFGGSRFDWTGRVMNTGVIVFDEIHAGIFREFDKKYADDSYIAEQPYINLFLDWWDVPVFHLKKEFNSMPLTCNLGVDRLKGYIIHYAGWKPIWDFEFLLHTIRHDLSYWEMTIPPQEKKDTCG